MTKTRKLTANEADALHAELMATARTVVEKAIEKIALRPPQSSLDGTMLTISKDEVGLLFLGLVDMYSAKGRFKIVFPDDLGLTTRHLLESLRGDCGEVFTTIVNMLLVAETCGAEFIHARKNEINEMFDLFMGDLVTRARPAAK